jgi:hypothetical protein
MVVLFLVGNLMQSVPPLLELQVTGVSGTGTLLAAVVEWAVFPYCTVREVLGLMEVHLAVLRAVLESAMVVGVVAAQGVVTIVVVNQAVLVARVGKVQYFLNGNRGII